VINWWNGIVEKVGAKTQRERIIISVLLLATVYFLFSFFVLVPLDREKTTLKNRIEIAEKEIKKFSAQELVLAQALSNDPNAAKKKEIDRMEARLKEIDKNLQALSTGLIAAGELPQALHDVLHSTGSLTLIGLQTMEPSRLNFRTETAVQSEIANKEGNSEEENREFLSIQQKDDAENGIGVFKHSVVVSLEGTYFDVIAYLIALEKLPWKIYWEEIDYQVKQYPMASVTIEVYTLSTEAGVLSV